MLFKKKKEEIKELINVLLDNVSYLENLNSLRFNLLMKKDKSYSDEMREEALNNVTMDINETEMKIGRTKQRLRELGVY